MKQQDCRQTAGETFLKVGPLKMATVHLDSHFSRYQNVFTGTCKLTDCDAISAKFHAFELQVSNVADEPRDALSYGQRVVYIGGRSVR